MADNTHEHPPDPQLLSASSDPVLRDHPDIDLSPPAPDVADSTEEIENAPHLPYNVVGIGASAGGVEAYMELFANLPPDTGMAYVVISHLMPAYKSHLPEILARYTAMPVVEIETGMRPEPDRIHVAPPRSSVHLKLGVLHLEPLTDRTPRTIDQFFRSLAADQSNRAVGVVLSGMDGDGALGLRAIKGEGGIAIVQSPGSAQFPDMPRTSIATEHVDVVLPPDAIGRQLAQIGSQFRGKAVRLLQEGKATSEDERNFLKILALLRAVSGVDFRLYKPATIRRRIARRMLLHRVHALGDYFLLLQANSAEVFDLHEDALINVTHFFRDPEVFENLTNLVLPRMLEGRDPDEQIRIWVAGCSTGEEAYSITICLLEFMKEKSLEPAIQIFGTDASEQNIQRARAGIYAETIASEVSAERLRRFFIKTEKGYQVSKRVRDLCIFARQNLCHDPPFSRIDVISCRNVLIYFGTELQRQLVPTLHYALRPNGHLLLGTSETIREFTDLFALVNRKSKIYVKTAPEASRAVVDIVPHLVTPKILAPQALPTESWVDVELQRAADRIVLARYGPPGIVVNERLEILQSRGHTSPFLEMRQGAATLQLPRMARDAIAPAVIAAVRRAIDRDVPVKVEGLRVSDEGSSREITLEVLPIQSLAHRERCYLVLFAPAGRVKEPESSQQHPYTLEPPENKDRLISKMWHDLSSTKLYLQSLLEERDAKNHELVSANEEIQSANEELQSTNEELETTKEELQSANEELHTVNDELQNRNAVLTQASDDLHNLLNSVNLPVLMLNNDLNIRQFTPPTQRVMNLRASDVGRPFGDIRMNLAVNDLTPLFQEVLETLGAREMEVQDRDGRWYLLRVRPYRTADNKIEGLVIALVDIDQLRKSQHELRAARDFARSVIESIPLPLAVLDLDFRIQSTNEAFCALTGLALHEIERRLLPDLSSVLWSLDQPLRSRLEQMRTAKVLGASFQFQHQTPGKNARTFLIRCRMLQPDSEHFLLITIEDITTHQEAERLLTADKDRLASEVESTTKELGRSQDELRALTSSLLTTQEDERRRIARELHDDVSQRLAALDIDSDEVQRSIASKPDEAVTKLQKLRGQIGVLADDVRNMSHHLHPSMIEELGLAPALRALTEDFDRGERMIATFSARSVPASIPIQVATGLYRIAQEALRNVAKHAGRTHVRLMLKGTKTGVRLEISDAGLGFDPSENRSGLGLVSMEERARIIGATLEVKSALGQGTTVIINAPLERANTGIPDARGS